MCQSSHHQIVCDIIEKARVHITFSEHLCRSAERIGRSVLAFVACFASPHTSVRLALYDNLHPATIKGVRLTDIMAQKWCSVMTWESVIRPLVSVLKQYQRWARNASFAPVSYPF